MSLTFSAGAVVKAQAATNAVEQAGQPVDLTYASKKALAAVVSIKTVQNSKTKVVEMNSDPFGDFFSDPFGFFGNPGQGNGGRQKRQVRTPKQEGLGSGVIISPDGYIVTNNHVVAGADELTVTLEDNREFNAKIIGTDPTTDLALIKIEGKNLPTLPIGDSDKLKVGQWVIAVGSHRGVISGRDFAALQRRLAQNALLHPREQAARNSYALLTGLLVCGRCGAKMYTQPQSDGHGGRRASGAFLYVCERRKRFGKSACDCPSVSGLQLDAAVREALAAYRSDDTAFGARLAGLRDVQGRRHTADSELAAVQAAVAEAEKKLHTLLNRLADPELPEEALRYIRAQSREMAERIATDRERIEQLKAAEAQSDRVEQGYRQICALLDRFSADYGNLSIPEQRDVLRGVIDRVEWNGESAQIFPIQP